MGLLDGENTSSPTVEEFLRRLTAQVSFGVPIDVNNAGTEVGQHVSEMRGSWVEISIISATGTVTCTHNLNIPISTVTGAGSTANRLNVRWLKFGYEFGSRTGAVAQPAAPAGAFTIEFLHMLSSAVTADAITLNYSVVGFTPTATTPLFVSLFFIPAVR